MLPHYPASSEWATVGGYVAARGSGVLSTRYGKIEDLVLSLRVALADGRADRHRRRPAPRRRPGPDAALRRLGGHARDHHPRDARDRPAAGRAPLPRRCSSRTSRPASRPSGARSRAGYRPSVIRMYDEEATRRTLSPVVGEPLDGVCAIVCCEGEPAAVAVEGSRTVELAREEGARELDPALAQTLVGPPLRVLQAAAPPGAARDLGHDRRRRDLHEHRRRPPGAARPPCATATRRRASSCGCTSRTGTAGAR